MILEQLNMKEREEESVRCERKKVGDERNNY